MAKEKTKKSANKKTAAAKSSTKTTEVKPMATVEKALPKVKVKAVPVTPVAKLARWQKWLGLLLGLQGLLVVVLTKKVTVPVTAQYLNVDALASEANGHQVLAIANRHLMDLHVVWVLATALIVFTVVNLLSAGMFRARDNKVAAEGANQLRWIGLGLSGGLAVMTIALLSGFTQLSNLLLLFVSMVVGCAAAMGADKLVANNGGVKTRFTHLLCGIAVVGVLMPWVVFGLGMIGAWLWHGHLPAYLYSIYACQALLTLALILATRFRLKRQGKWADPLYTEGGFLVLTFVSLTLLTWQVFAGALR